MKEVAGANSQIPEKPKIQVVSSSFSDHEFRDALTVFINIGAGETDISVCCGEGDLIRRWTGVFGWSYLFSIPLFMGGNVVFLQEVEAVARALRNPGRMFGRPAETRKWVELAIDQMRQSIDDILARTVGSGAEVDEIVICGPGWIHGLLSHCLDLRMNVNPKIMES